MRPDDVLTYLRRQPFQPFRLHLTDGTLYEIRHPEMMKVGRSQAHLFFHKQDDPQAVVLRFEGVALLRIDRIELVEVPTTPATP